MTAIDWRETSSEALGIESWRQMQPPVHEALINGRRYLAYQVTGVRRDLARVVIARAEVSEEDRWEANPLLVLPMLRPRTFRTLTLRILWDRLISISDEIVETLVRTSFSTIVRKASLENTTGIRS